MKTVNYAPLRRRHLLATDSWGLGVGMYKKSRKSPCHENLHGIEVGTGHEAGKRYVGARQSENVSRLRATGILKRESQRVGEDRPAEQGLTDCHTACPIRPAGAAPLQPCIAESFHGGTGMLRCFLVTQPMRGIASV